MEVPKITGIHARPLINGKNQFYYIRAADEYAVMKRFKTREDKPVKVYKTERGARNCAYHMNIN
jgi:hypothetical protein